MSHPEVQTGPVFPLKGGCACGNIRYSLKAAPFVIHCCHCKCCQRETGTAYALNALVEGDDVTLLPSAPVNASPLRALATFPPSAFDDWTPRQSGPDSDNNTTNGNSRAHGAASDGEVQEETTDGRIPAPVLLPVPAESGEPQLIARCPVCMTPVWSNYNGSGPLLKFLRVGTLDSPASIGGPDVHIFVRSKQPSVDISDGKPRFDGFYPQKEGVWRPEGLARREKLVARIVEWRNKQAGVAR
ncbi:glutathione-dependent aldehyde-activating protein [Colletotrichum sojae]|uniref:Glutathione-dependent aldehyde-activating protein n=1 Tax=Colletotrichum sojae TaxID=2175907 RepID=A0A8H6N2Y2_9PEZI|nr:glutathione-dependent aldehyde-activating protein [Colletotrichum sojae]